MWKTFFVRSEFPIEFQFTNSLFLLLPPVWLEKKRIFKFGKNSYQLIESSVISCLFVWKVYFHQARMYFFPLEQLWLVLVAVVETIYSNSSISNETRIGLNVYWQFWFSSAKLKSILYLNPIVGYSVQNSQGKRIKI